MCASTGVAAVHVNGCTFHSFLGCGFGGLKDWEKVKFQKSKNKAAPGSGGETNTENQKNWMGINWEPGTLEGSDFQVSKTSCCGQCSVLYLLG